MRRATSSVPGDTPEKRRRRRERAKYRALSQLATEKRPDHLRCVTEVRSRVSSNDQVAKAALRELGKLHPERFEQLRQRHLQHLEAEETTQALQLMGYVRK